LFSSYFTINPANVYAGSEFTKAELCIDFSSFFGKPLKINTSERFVIELERGTDFGGSPFVPVTVTINWFEP